MEAKYDGKSTVMQHGAKRAAIPATNAAIIDALKSNSIILDPLLNNFRNRSISFLIIYKLPKFL